MEHNILLVDDQREILRFLRAALETLKNVKIKVFESQSGEEALLESTRHKIDLLVTDYKLPGMTGLELMHKIRARHPDAKVILISGVSERKARQELANAGALAIFDKPISVADFLDAVERALGLVKTIFAAELKAEAVVQEDQRPLKPSELLTNFRQDVNADAVLLINDSGFVQARAGKLRDESEEERVLPFLNQVHKASLAISSGGRGSYHIFVGKDFDLLFAPINPAYSVLIAGAGLASEERVMEMTANLLGLRSQVEKSLRSIGQTGALHERKIPSPEPAPEPPLIIPEDTTPAADLEALFSNALQSKTSAPAASDAEDFWNQAAEQHGSKPANSNVISLEEARKRGLISDEK
ncbi:MAG: hypothetical protein Fur002_23740 [Anaerolineales bacterium]